MKTGVLALVALLLALCLGGFEFVNERNKLIAERAAIVTAWSQVDRDLQRRAELIPNLIETVRASVKEESPVFRDVANARDAVAGARTPQEKIEANSRLTGALGRLLVIAEAYPELKVGDNFRQVEESILQSRRRYNEAVQKYNTDLKQSPANLVASMSGLRREDAYFRTEPGTRNASDPTQIP